MPTNPFDLPDADVAWCPGCGNFALHRILKQCLAELNIQPESLVLVSGIGQAAKLPQYTRAHMFNGLHGRALPVAMAIQAANPSLKVIVNSGDGCSYGEGGNHFLYQILRNPNITQIVHNNQVYGLTKGQASPTSPKGMVTPVQVSGVTNEPFNPLAVAIALGATFVARANVGDAVQTKEVLVKAISHRGYALVDVFCPCVSFNKYNTYEWYKAHSAPLPVGHDPADQKAAFAMALNSDPYYLGIFYKVEGHPVFTDSLAPFKTSNDPLFTRPVDLARLRAALEAKRTF